jgi:hypothetical protein
MQLSPCPACKRHVAIEATSCPFCEAALAPPATNVDPARLSRAAVFAFGAATVASTVLGACWTNKSEPQHVQQQTAVTPDAAVAPTPDAVVGIDDPDPDRGQYQNHPCVDTPQGPMCAPYGAPPARRRLV